MVEVVCSCCSMKPLFSGILIGGNPQKYQNKISERKRLSISMSIAQDGAPKK